MGWKEKLALTGTRGVVHRVNGEEVTFYPLSPTALFRFEGIASDLGLALSSLFQNTKADHGYEDREFAEGREFVSQPVDEAIARLRWEQRREAIEKICHAAFTKESQDLLAEVLMDSMRDVFGERKEWPPATEFLNSISLEDLKDMLWGVAKANKGLLGPLAESLDTSFLSRLGQSLASRVKAFEEAPSSEENKPADGTGSDANSSGSPAEATPSMSS